MRKSGLLILTFALSVQALAVEMPAFFTMMGKDLGCAAHLRNAEKSLVAGGTLIKESGWNETVRIVGRVPGKNGGFRYLLKRIGSSWNGLGTTSALAPQGDVRWFSIMFGVEGAAFLGFEVLSDDLATIPDADELNGGLKLLNEVLPDEYKVLMSFYELTGRTYAELMEYVEKFANEFMLPFSTHPAIRLHDTIFHSEAIVLGQEAWDYQRLFNKEIHLLRAHLTQYLLSQMYGEVDDFDRLLVAKLTKNLHLVPAFSIDGGTGNIGSLFSLFSLEGMPTDVAETLGAAFGGQIGGLIGHLPFEIEGPLKSVGEELGIAPSSMAIQLILAPVAILNRHELFSQVVNEQINLNGATDSATEHLRNVRLPDEVEYNLILKLLKKRIPGGISARELFDEVENYIVKRKVEEPRIAAPPPLTRNEYCTLVLKRTKEIRKGLQILADKRKAGQIP